MGVIDRYRIGTFGTTGRFTSVLDLNPGTGTYEPLRDTFKITPPAQTNVLSKNNRRYGGARRVAELHDNGQIEFELYLRGATPDATWALWDAIMAIIEEDRTQYYFEWRPSGSTYSTYFELRATTWEPMYRWIEFQSTNVMHAKFGFDVAPLALGDQMDILDDFAIDTITAGDYTFDAGAGTAAVAGGVMTVSSTAVKSLIHTGRGYTHADAWVSSKYTPGAAFSSNPSAGVIIKRLDATNYIYAALNGGSPATMSIFKVDNGVQTTLGTSGTFSAPTSGQSYWLTGRSEGNLITADHFITDPKTTATATATISVTLAGGDATKFGANVQGRGGIRITPPATDWTWDDLRIEPYTYSTLTLPAAIDLPSVPGTAPAKFDARVAPTVAVPFAMFAWGKVSGTGSALSIIEGEAAGSVSNFTAGAVAGARGGSSLNSNAGATDLIGNWTLDPSTVAGNSFGNEVDLEIWGMIDANASLSSVRAITSFQPTTGSLPFYTREWGLTGKSLILPSAGAALRPVRLGTLTLPSTAGTGTLRVEFITGVATAASSLRVDYLIVNPARQRALTPTSKPNDASYPLFTRTANNIKLVRSDLSALEAATVAALPGSPSSGLGGQLLELAPGTNRVLPFLATAVPDDPTSNTASSVATVSGGGVSGTSIHFAVQPRYFLTRSS